MQNVKAQSSNKYQITKLKVKTSFDIWILTFGIAIWVAQRNLGNRALGRAQKSGNSRQFFLEVFYPID